MDYDLFKKVVDQGIQLNRILRLLEEEEMSLFKRYRLYDSDSRAKRVLRTYSTHSFDPFQSAYESSSSALKRNKLFEVKVC